ncbi:MAG: YicC family protein [Clostridia bacterium]|nr:YicC family protein [Clostridia bacterium]
MLSMTGYGRATCERDDRRLTVEIKTVNHRFLDLSIRMPRNLAFLEDDLRKGIGERLTRGHADVFVTYVNHRADAREVTVDKALFNADAEALAAVAGTDLRDDRSLMAVAKLPDVITVTEAEEDREALKALMKEALTGALDELVAMRTREGVSMAEDLLYRAELIEKMTGEIEVRYPDTVAAYTERLRKSVEELIGQNVDETRLLTEVAVMAEKSAIAEETVRLHSHIAQLREVCGRTEPIGRRLDFLVQEINREVNTISSKSQDIPITKLVIDMKSEIEKLREQLQNVE